MRGAYLCGRRDATSHSLADRGMSDFKTLVELSDEEATTPHDESVLTSIGRRLVNKLKRPRSRGSSTRTTPSATPTHSAPASPLKKAFRDDLFDFNFDETDPSCAKATADGDTASSKQRN